MLPPKAKRRPADQKLAQAIGDIYNFLGPVSQREGNLNLRQLAQLMRRAIEVSRGEEPTTPAPPPSHHA